MAYEPKTWECGEVVTADALNNMEQGIADASSGGGIEIKYGLIRTGQTSYSINHIHEGSAPTPATADDFQDIASQMAIKDFSNYNGILWKTSEPNSYGIGLTFSTMYIIEGSGSYIHSAHINQDMTVSMIEKTL